MGRVVFEAILRKVCADAFLGRCARGMRGCLFGRCARGHLRGLCSMQILCAGYARDHLREVTEGLVMEGLWKDARQQFWLAVKLRTMAVLTKNDGQKDNRKEPRRGWPANKFQNHTFAPLLAVQVVF